MHHFWRSVSFREAADHPSTFTKIDLPSQVLLCFMIEQMVPIAKVTTYVFFLYFQETLSLGYLEINFRKINLVSYFVKCHHWEKVYLLSYG